jgi:hypothetical protein
MLEESQASHHVVMSRRSRSGRPNRPVDRDICPWRVERFVAHDEAVTAAITRRRRPWWPWLTWLSAIGLASAALALEWRQLMPGRGDTAANLAANLALAVGYPLAGAIILTHRRHHPIGTLLCAVGLASAVALFSYQYANRAVILEPGSLPFGELAAWLSSWSWALGVIPAVTLLPLLFPDGDLPSRRWRPVGAAGVGGTWLAAVGHALVPGPLEDFPSIRNPMGIPALGSIPAGAPSLVGRAWCSACWECWRQRHPSSAFDPETRPRPRRNQRPCHGQWPTPRR